MTESVSIQRDREVPLHLAESQTEELIRSRYHHDMVRLYIERKKTRGGVTERSKQTRSSIDRHDSCSRRKTMDYAPFRATPRDHDGAAAALNAGGVWIGSKLENMNDYLTK